MQVIYPEKRDRESGAKPRTAWTPPSSDLKSRHRFEYHDRVDQDAVEVEGCSGYTLPRRGGRVVECGGLENRYVGNPGVGGSNPPLSAGHAAARRAARSSLKAVACQQRFALKGSLSANPGAASPCRTRRAGAEGSPIPSLPCHSQTTS